MTFSKLLIFFFGPRHLNRNSCVISQAETFEGGAEVLDDPDDNPPGDHTGAGRKILALRVHPSDYPGLVVHDVAASQTINTTKDDLFSSQTVPARPQLFYAF